MITFEIDEEHTDFLVFGRRLHNAFRYAINNGDGRNDDQWLLKEKPKFEHYTCGMYLTGNLSFLEGKYGKKCWKQTNPDYLDFNSFMQTLNEKQKNNFNNIGISEKGLEALICIRNAITHNNNDISKNDDCRCIEKVTELSILGVELNENIITLTKDFMEFVRLSFVALSFYQSYLATQNNLDNR